MTITFPDTTIRFLDIRGNKEGADLYAKINLTAELTEAVRRQMKWGVIEKDDAAVDLDPNWPPQCESGSDLLGELNIRTMQMKPNQKELKSNKISIGANVLDSFSWKLVKNKENASRAIQLDFIARTSDFESILRIVQYYGAVRGSASGLIVSYDQQTNLPGMEDGTEATEEAPAQTEFAEV